MGPDRVCFVPSKAIPSSVTSAADTGTLNTYLKRDSGNTEGSLCDWVELKGRQLLAGFHIGDLTSANAAPYRITLSKALSVDSFIKGEYFSNNPSSSWSNERKYSAYANLIS